MTKKTNKTTIKTTSSKNKVTPINTKSIVNSKSTTATNTTTTTKQKDVVKHTNVDTGILEKFLKYKEDESKPKESTTTIAVEPEINLEDYFASQLAEYKYAPITQEELVKPITYVLAKNGLFRVTKTDVAIFKTLEKKFDKPISGLPEMEVGVELLIPKIEFKYIIQALTFFKDVFNQDGTESSLLFFWNTNDKPLPDVKGIYNHDKLVVYCPEQVNSHTLTKFDKDTTLPWLRSNLGLLLELHSHCDFSAFFSGTDDANENMNQFYGVWGYVNKDIPMFKFRWVSGDVKMECDPDVLIDWPVVEYKETTEQIVKASITVEDKEDLVDIDKETLTDVKKTYSPKVEVVRELVKGPYVELNYPKEWLDVQHSTEKYKYLPGYAGGTKYQKTTYTGVQSSFYDYDDYYGYDIADNYGYKPKTNKTNKVNDAYYLSDIYKSTNKPLSKEDEDFTEGYDIGFEEGYLAAQIDLSEEYKKGK